MKSTYYILLALLLFVSKQVISQDELIDFDVKKNRVYFKNHLVMAVNLDQKYNSWGKTDNYAGAYAVLNTTSNYAKPLAKTYFIHIEYYEWIYGWMQKNHNLRLYFSPKPMGKHKLIGYSKKKWPMQVSDNNLGEAPKLINYTNIKKSEIKKNEYVCGRIDMDAYDIYPCVGKQSFMLIYPHDLTEKFGNQYGEVYQLQEPISARLLYKLFELKANQVVLKKESKGHHSIVGYTL